MKCGRRVTGAAVMVGAAVGVAYVLWRRRQPHLVAGSGNAVSFKHPVLIINPHSGDGKAKRIGLAGSAENLGIETVVRKKGEKISKLAKSAVDRGCDHLIIAGGDGSLAHVAKVAIEHDVAFSCVPSGTRNHFAMDLGLDRSDPAKALDAAFGGVEIKVDVGHIGKRVFLNNVSFGIYADAIADPGYRGHKTESLVDATEKTIEDPDTRISVEGPDGEAHDDIEVILVSNNPYRFIGAPDFAGRASLELGTLGVILTDRTSSKHTSREHTEVKRWSSPTLTVRSTQKKIHIGVDGSLHEHHSPAHLRIDHAALRVVVPAGLVKQELQETSAPTNEALADLSGASA